MFGSSQDGAPKLTKKIWLYASPVLALVAIYAGWVMFSRWQENKDLEYKAAQQARAREKENAEKSVESLGGSEFKILGFYATPGTIRHGESAQLCYGVSNANTVALDPPVAEMWPSVSRCFDISPKKTTKYTLTATSKQGETQTLSLEITVH